jgi:hypothetical protein
MSGVNRSVPLVGDHNPSRNEPIGQVKMRTEM